MQLKIKNQQGVGLIEVLIAVLVLAVGLLGFAALQTQAVRVNYETLQRARASAFAEEVFDRMRANVLQATKLTNNYERDFNEALPVITNINCYTASCSTIELRHWDLNVLVNRLKSVAPGGDVAIEQDEDNPSLYKVTVRMVEAPTLKSSTQSAITQSDLMATYEFYSVL